MKDETDGVANKTFVGLKWKTYSFLVNDTSKYKKANGVSRNIVAKIRHNEYKDVLLNNNFFRYSMNKS